MAGVAGPGFGSSVAVADEEDAENLDDAGNPIPEDGNGVGPVNQTVESQNVNPTPPPDGTIRASSYSWISPGAPGTGNDYGLRLTDDGGVDFEFTFQTPDDLTIDTYWRHYSGGSLAYLWNDFDSTASGFRAFTNGIAGSGLYFRNVFGGSDISVSSYLQDGNWYNVRTVLDASSNTYSVYIDGDLVGQSYYDASGFTTSSLFRAMGRYSGSSTLIDYDRYVWASEAIHPPEDVTSSLLHYELEDGSGTTVTNQPVEDRDEFEDAKERKLDLAAHIDETTRRLAERPTVENVLDTIQAGIDDGTLSTAEGVDRAERLLLGENVTQLTYAGISPTRDIAPVGRANAELDVPGDIASHDLAVKSVRGVVATLTSLLISSRSLRAIYDNVPSRLKRYLDRGLDEIGRGIDYLAETVLGGFAELIDEVVFQSRNYADEIEAMLQVGGEEAAKEAAEWLFEKLTGITDWLAWRFVQNFEDRTPNNLESGLSDLNEGVRPPADPGGTIGDANVMAQSGMDDIVDDLEGASNAFRALDIFGTVVDVFAAAGKLLAATGILAIASAAIALVNTVTQAKITVVEGIIGTGTINWIVTEHNETLAAVVAPEGS